MIDASQLAGGQAPVHFVVRTSSKYKHLFQVMKDSVHRARQEPGLTWPLLDLSLSVSDLDVQVNKVLTAKPKISVPAIGDPLAMILGARVVSGFSWLVGLHDNVRELEAAARDSLSALDEISVRAMDGTLLPLSAYIQAAEATGSNALRLGASLGVAIAESQRTTQAMLPSDVAHEFVGHSCQMRQADALVGLMFLLTLMLSYLFLAAQIENSDDPVIVLITMSFAIVGALLALAVVPLVYGSIVSRTRTTLPAPHPRVASCGGLVAVLGE